MLRDPDEHCPLRPIKLSLCFQEIEGRVDGTGGRGIAGCFIVPPPQPGTHPGAAHRPGLSMAIDDEIRKGGAVGGMKQLGADRDSGEQIGRHDVGVSTTAAGTAAAGAVLRLG